MESTEFTKLQDATKAIPAIQYVASLPIVTEELAVRIGAAMHRWLTRYAFSSSIFLNMCSAFISETRIITYDQNTTERKVCFFLYIYNSLGFCGTSTTINDI